MWLASFRVKAFTNNLAILDNNTTHHRIRASTPNSLSSKLHTPPHIKPIISIFLLCYFTPEPNRTTMVSYTGWWLEHHFRGIATIRFGMWFQPQKLGGELLWLWDLGWRESETWEWKSLNLHTSILSLKRRSDFASSATFVKVFPRSEEPMLVCFSPSKIYIFYVKRKQCEDAIISISRKS